MNAVKESCNNSRPPKSNDSPDRGWAWVVLLAAFSNAVIIQGMLKSGGVLYSAFPDSMDMTTGQAAIVSTISEAIMRAMAPMAGSLAQRLSYRWVVFVGGLLASTGLLACFFATTFFEVLITFGVMYGLGSSLILIPGDVIVGLYFDRYRAMALGIEFAGGPLGAVFVAPLLEWLIEEYQLRGTLMLYAGLALHSCAAALVYRKGHWFSAAKVPEVSIHKVPSSATIVSIVDDGTSSPDVKRTISKTSSNSVASFNSPVSDDLSEVHVAVMPTRHGNDFATARRRSISLVHHYLSKELKAPPELPYHPFPESETTGSELNISTRCDTTSTYSLDSTSSTSCLDNLRERMSFLREPSFWLVNITNMSMVMGFPMVLTMLPTFARTEVDTTLSRQTAGLLLSIFNLADLFGRVSFGWVSDRRCFSRQTGFMGTLLLAGAIVCLFPLADSFTTTILCTVAYGIAIGSASIFPAVILSEAIGTERFPVAYGFIITTSSIASFSSGPILGAILDETGSYKPCFYVLSAVLIAGGVVWVMEMIVRKIRGRTKDVSHSVTE